MKTRICTLDQWQQFIEAFETGCLPKSQWTHESHFIVGLWFVARHTPNEALSLLRSRIRNYNVSTGGVNSDSSGYHETLTRLYVVGIHNFAAQQTLSGIDLLDALLDSPIVAKSWPLQFYSQSQLMSAKARREWAEPDLAPLPNDCFAATT